MVRPGQEHRVTGNPRNNFYSTIKVVIVLYVNELAPRSETLAGTFPAILQRAGASVIARSMSGATCPFQAGGACANCVAKVTCLAIEATSPPPKGGGFDLRLKSPKDLASDPGDSLEHLQQSARRPLRRVVEQPRR